MWPKNLNQSNIDLHYILYLSPFDMAFLPSIPVDMYDSHQELVIIIPLG
jgi:hypothetical protein